MEREIGRQMECRGLGSKGKERADDRRPASAFAKRPRVSEILVGDSSVLPEIPEETIAGLADMAEVSPGDALRAMKMFDAKGNLALEWLLASSEEEKEKLVYLHEQRRRHEEEDLKMALELQKAEQQEHKDFQQQKQRERERQHTNMTGMVGDLGERSTRRRGTKVPSLALDQRAVGGGCNFEKSKAPGRGMGLRESSRKSSCSPPFPPSNAKFSSNIDLERLDRHKFLQNAVVVNGRVGRVCEAFNAPNGQALLVVRTIENGELDWFYESAFVTDGLEHYNLPFETVWILPETVHIMGSTAKQLSMGEPNSFHYEKNVVCDVPETAFGPKYEYISFQTLDPHQTDFTFHARMRFEEKLLHARSLFLGTRDAYGNDLPGGGEKEKFALQHGSQFKLRIFDTDKCRCRAIAEACVCKKGRGWGVLAEEDIPKGAVVMEYVGVIKLKPGKKCLKAAAGVETSIGWEAGASANRHGGWGRASGRNHRQSRREETDEEGENTGSMGAEAEAEAEEESTAPDKNAGVVENVYEGRGASMTEAQVAEELKGKMVRKYFSNYGWFDGTVQSYHPEGRAFEVLYEDSDLETMSLKQLMRCIKVNHQDEKVREEYRELKTVVRDFLAAEEAKGQEAQAGENAGRRHGPDEASRGREGREGADNAGVEAICQVDGAHAREEVEGGGCSVKTAQAELAGQTSPTGAASCSDGAGGSTTANGGGVCDDIHGEKGRGTLHENRSPRGERVEESREESGRGEGEGEVDEVDAEGNSGGMDLQNYVFDVNKKGKWLVDATEKGNVRYALSSPLPLLSPTYPSLPKSLPPKIPLPHSLSFLFPPFVLSYIHAHPLTHKRASIITRSLAPSHYRSCYSIPASYISALRAPHREPAS